MSSMNPELKAVIQYLTDRGMTVTATDEQELLARMQGHNSAQVKTDFEEQSNKFFGYRVDLSDYNDHGVFTNKNTRLSTPICQGSLDEVHRYVTLEAMAWPFVFAVYDGNGKLQHLFDKSDLELAVYTTVGELRLPDAAILTHLADDAVKVSGGVYRWNHVMQDVARARQELSQRGATRQTGKTLVVVTIQHTGLILWRQIV